MKLYVRKDEWGWDAPLLEAAKQIGLEAQPFQAAAEVPDSPNTHVFIHMRHSPRFREGDKQTAESLNQKKNVVLIPSIYECRLYDDKIRQARGIGKWLPKTLYLTTPEEAELALARASFPIISKANGGAGSSNVRIVQNAEQAQAEIEAVFKGDGIVLHENLRQKHYLLWQDFCPQNENDWRVIIIAKRYGMILKRFNRPDLPFASGSGNFEAVTELDSERRESLDLTLNFASEYDFNFLGVDLVKNQQQNFTILEMTAGWDMKGYVNCRFFERKGNDWQPTEHFGPDMFLLTAKAVKEHGFLI